ncbi:MAG: hypothetical protein ACYS18_05500 [Planctomycetota bacterium]
MRRLRNLFLWGGSVGGSESWWVGGFGGFFSRRLRNLFLGGLWCGWPFDFVPFDLAQGRQGRLVEFGF